MAAIQNSKAVHTAGIKGGRSLATRSVVGSLSPVPPVSQEIVIPIRPCLSNTPHREFLSQEKCQHLGSEGCPERQRLAYQVQVAGLDVMGLSHVNLQAVETDSNDQTGKGKELRDGGHRGQQGRAPRTRRWASCGGTLPTRRPVVTDAPTLPAARLGAP